MKTLKLYFTALLMVFTVTMANAHPANISSTALVKGEDGQWTLQIMSAMTAFQYEVKNAFGEDAYDSPEAFNKLLIKHLRSHIGLKINNQDISVGTGFVRLGHATLVVLEVKNVPDDIRQVWVKNEGFKNLNKSRSLFSISAGGLSQSKLTLEEANDYQLSLSLENNKLLVTQEASVNTDVVMLASALILAALIGLLFFRNTTRKKIINLNHA